MSALLEPFIHEPRIAYFSMEIALRSEIPTYSGGLGVLTREPWAPHLPAKVALQIGSREVWVGTWLNSVEGHRGKPQTRRADVSTACSQHPGDGAK